MVMFVFCLTIDFVFTNRDIADYYNQTLQHYQQWWQLDKALAVHYGVWLPNTHSFREALKNTNIEMAKLAGIVEGSRVLDAGCGVGGSSFFLAEAYGCQVTGVTLSEKQLAYAQEQNLLLGWQHVVDFKLEDYTRTSLPSADLDLIWAIESLTSAPDKKKFALEAYRLLKPGGVLVVADYYQVEGKPDPDQWLEKWRRTWSLAPFIPESSFVEDMACAGLVLEESLDFTKEITPTARRMYYASLAATLPSLIYDALFKASRFSRTHYKSGIFQYKALKKGLWEYKMMKFRKPL